MPRDQKMIEAQGHMKRGLNALKMARLLETQPGVDPKDIKAAKAVAGAAALDASKALGVKAPAKKAPAKKAPAKKKAAK